LIVRRAEGFQGAFDFFAVYDPLLWTMIMCFFVAFGLIGVLVRAIERRLRFRKNIDTGGVSFS
jgi:hypothetical protein